MLRTALSRTFRSVYDALGSLVLGNVVWFALTAPWCALLYVLIRRETGTFLMIGAACVVPIAFLNPGSAGLALMGQQLAQTGETRLRTYWTGLRAHVFRSLLLMSLGVLTTMVLGSGVAYYLGGGLALLGRLGNLVGAVATGGFGALVAASGCYWLPVAVGVPGKPPRIVFVLRRSWGLALDGPGFALGVFGVTLAQVVFWSATVLGVVTVGMGVIAVFQAQARHVLFDRADVVAELQRSGVRVTRHEIKTGLRARWASEPRLRLRDIVGRAGP